MIPIARIVLRDSGAERDGLILGALFLRGEGMLKRGHVYEIRVHAPEYQDVLGPDPLADAQLVDMGESCVPKDRFSAVPGEHVTACCWQNEAGTVLDGCHGGLVVLTRAEYAALARRR